MFARTLRLCLTQQTYQTWSCAATSRSAPSSSNQTQSDMRRLFDTKRYADALSLYQRSSKCPTHYDSTLALRACAKLHNYPAGVRIHQQLSAQVLQNQFIQTALIHFYSRQQLLLIARHVFTLALQCNADALIKRKRSLHNSRRKRYICMAPCSKVDY